MYGDNDRQPTESLYEPLAGWYLSSINIAKESGTMGLSEILKKYGMQDMSKDGWFILKEEADSVDHKQEFTNSSYYRQLRQEIHHSHRIISHALDNYGADMEDEFREELERLRKATGDVLECMEYPQKGPEGL